MTTQSIIPDISSATTQTLTPKLIVLEMPSSNPIQSPNHSPFMALPPELRLTIYDFALENTIAAAIDKDFYDFVTEKPPTRLGAMALPYTSAFLRKESTNAMYALVNQKWAAICARRKVLRETVFTSRRDQMKDELRYQAAREEYFLHARTRIGMLRWLSTALEKARE
jgi:hypothetical protein